MQVTPHGGLANRCTRPLCDLSVATAAEILSWAEPLRLAEAEPIGRVRGAPPTQGATRCSTPTFASSSSPRSARAGRPPAVPGDRDLLRAPEPRALGQALPDAVGRGGPARPEDHRLPGRQRGRLRPAGTEGHLDPIRFARRRRPGARSSRSGRSPGSSTGWPRSRSRAGDHRGFQFLQWFIAEQVEEETKLQRLVDLIDSGINLFQAEAQLDAFE